MSDTIRKWFNRKPKKAKPYEKEITQKYLNALVEIAELKYAKIIQIQKEVEDIRGRINQ